MSTTMYLGLDIGHVSDFSAHAIVQRARDADSGDLVYLVRDLRRYEDRPSSPELRRKMQALINAMRGQGHDVVLAVDARGPGQSQVYEMSWGNDSLQGHSFLYPVVTTTGQDESPGKQGARNVPKNKLIGDAKELLEWRRLKVTPDLPHAKLFEEELRSFRPRVTTAGNVVFEAQREGEHDDILFAVCLALWAAKRGEQRAFKVRNIRL
jgi:hypothetical protein